MSVHPILPTTVGSPDRPTPVAPPDQLPTVWPHIRTLVRHPWVRAAHDARRAA